MYNSTAMVHAQMPIYAMVPCNYYIHYFGIHMVLQKINLAQKSTVVLVPWCYHIILRAMVHVLFIHFADQFQFYFLF